MGSKKRRKVTAGFYDMNIPTDGLPLSEKKAVISMALHLGFSGVAHNRIVKCPLSDADICINKTLNLSDIPAETAVSAQLHRNIIGCSSGSQAFRQYSRVTVIVEEVIHSNAIRASNPVLRSYDIVAVRPMNQKVFELACTQMEVDIISLDFVQKLSIRLKPSAIKAAIERGIFFEVSISGAFQDFEGRRELFANAKSLQYLTRGKNIILSSGARSPMHLRGPNDITNLGTFFGLSRECAKASLSTNSETAILRGLRRKKTFKSTIIVEKISAWKDAQTDDSWFDIPKDWDPLCSTKLEDTYILPELPDNVQHEIDVTLVDEVSNGNNHESEAELHEQDYEDPKENESKDDDFLSIELNEEPIAHLDLNMDSNKKQMQSKVRTERGKAKQAKRKKG